MPRKRMIDPEFWLDEELAELSMEARLFYIGTWNFADDYGVIEYRTKKLKAQIFPYDDVDVERCIKELVKIGKLVPFSTNGRKYLYIKNFTKWQMINRPSKRRFAEPPQEIEDSLNTCKGLTEHSVSAHEQFTEQSVNTHEPLTEQSLSTHPEKEIEIEKEIEKENNTSCPENFPDAPSPPPNEKSSKRKERKYSYSDKDMELALLLEELILVNKPDYKFQGGKRRERWANEFRLMRERDGRSPERIEEVLRFSQNNPFWKKNILSAEKLREKFDRLEMEMRERKEENRGSFKGPPSLREIYDDSITKKLRKEKSNA